MRQKKRSLKNYSKETIIWYLEEVVSVYYHIDFKSDSVLHLLDTVEDGATRRRFWSRIDSFWKRIDAMDNAPYTRKNERKLNQLYKQHNQVLASLDRYNKRQEKKNAKS